MINISTHTSSCTVSYPPTRKDISEMGNSMCAHESSQTVRVNRVLSARIKSETPIWQGWVDLNTLKMVFRFGPKKPTAFHMDLLKFDAFATSSNVQQFVLFENANQAKWIRPSSNSKGLADVFKEACRSFQDRGPVMHGWMEKCSVQVEGDVTISSLDESSDMLQNSLFRPFQKRYCWFFVTQEERYFYYANDRNGENPKGFLAMSRCSSVKTILGEHPEMILRCAMTRERIKIYRFRVSEEDSSSDKKESHLSILPLTREWARIFNGESRPVKTRRKTKKSSITGNDGKFRVARRRKTPSQQQPQNNSSRNSSKVEKKDTSRRRTAEPSSTSTSTTTSTKTKSVPPSSSEIKTQKKKAKRRSKKKKEIKRTDSTSFRLIVKNWAKGKELIELIRDMPNILLPPSSNPGLKKTSERIETVASTYLSQGQCTIKELKKLYRLAVKYCHPDKWVQAQQGDVKAKIMCSEVFRMVQMRYEMMMQVFDESGETVYNI